MGSHGKALTISASTMEDLGTWMLWAYTEKGGQWIKMQIRQAHWPEVQEEVRRWLMRFNGYIVGYRCEVDHALQHTGIFRAEHATSFLNTSMQLLCLLQVNLCVIECIQMFCTEQLQTGLLDLNLKFLHCLPSSLIIVCQCCYEFILIFNGRLPKICFIPSCCLYAAINYIIDACESLSRGNLGTCWQLRRELGCQRVEWHEIEGQRLVAVSFE